MYQQDEKVDFSENPRKAFIGFLIYQLQPVVTGLYSNSAIMKRHSIGALIGIIDSLGAASKKELRENREALVRMQTAQVERFDDSELHMIYSNITSHLHKTYLAEVNWFKPFNTKPKHIGIEEDDRTEQ